MTDQPHILIVDDDREIRALLAKYLETNGFRTTPVADGKAMTAAMQQTHFDLIVLDLMLPGDDGLALCRELRRHSQIPIIMLTARGEDVDRIVGLEVGADDYLRQALQSAGAAGAHQGGAAARGPCAPGSGCGRRCARFRFGGWQLNTTTRTLTDTGGGSVALSGAEYRLLTVLLGSPSRVLSRSQLATLLRGREADPQDRSIDVRVSRLRQLLGDDARASQIIKTVYGEGYVIGVGVETA